MTLDEFMHGLELALCCGEGGFKSSDFTAPAAAMGFVDAGLKVRDDLLQSVLLLGSGRRAGQRTQACSWTQGVP